ncbi:MAG: tetratricopeptide repeat protein, partial [Pseudomonadota bacterium]
MSSHDNTSVAKNDSNNISVPFIKLFEAMAQEAKEKGYIPFSMYNTSKNNFGILLSIPRFLASLSYQGGIECYQHKKYNDSIQFFGESIKLRLNLTHEKNTEIVAHCFNNIGVSYEKMKKYDKALECFAPSLEIQKTINKGVNNTDEADIYRNMASSYFQQNLYKESLNYYNKTLNILQNTTSKNDTDIAQYLMSIGTIYGKLEKYNESLKYHNDALILLNKYYSTENNTNSIYIADVYKNIAITNFLRKNYTELEKYSELAFSIYNKYPDHDENIILESRRISAANFYLEKYDKSLKYYLLTLNKQRESNATIYEIADTLNDIAIIYNRLGDSTKSIEYYSN